MTRTWLVVLLSALAILLNFAAALAGFVLARWGVITHNRWFKALPVAVALALIAMVCIAAVTALGDTTSSSFSEITSMLE